MKKGLLLSIFLVLFAFVSVTTDMNAQGKGNKGNKGGFGNVGENKGFNGTCTNTQGSFTRGNFVDADGDGVCDNFIDEDGDGVCDHCANLGGGRGHRGFNGTCTNTQGSFTRGNFVDADGDGVCDNFIDEDGDGVCDHCANLGGGRGHRGFNGTCTRGGNFVDADGDGVCDNFLDADGDGVCDHCANLRGGRGHKGPHRNQFLDENQNGIPDNLEQSLYVFHNYPNPFSTSTTIKFYIPSDGTVSIVIRDAAGNVNITLYNGSLTAGEHTFEFIPDGIDSGIYFYTITFNDNTQTRKMFYRP